MPLLNNRLQKLAPGGYQIPSPTGGPDVPDISNRLSSLSNSQDATGSEYNTPILDQYKKTLANPPNPENYAPSKTRQVLGALAGMGAGAEPTGMTHGGPVGFRYDPKAQIGAQQAITDEPLNKATSRYNTQVGQLGKGAQVEEQDIAQKRGIEKLQADIANKETEHQIKQQQADTQAKKEQDIFNTKQQELQAKIDKANNDLQEKQKESAGKQANFEQQLSLHALQIKLVDATHQLQIAQKDRALSEAQRLHDMEKDKWNHDKEIQEAKLKAAQDAAKAKAAPTTTTTEEKKVGGVNIPLIGNIGGAKQKVITKTQQPNADPLGIR